MKLLTFIIIGLFATGFITKSVYNKVNNVVDAIPGNKGKTDCNIRKNVAYGMPINNAAEIKAKGEFLKDCKSKA